MKNKEEMKVLMGLIISCILASWLVILVVIVGVILPAWLLAKFIFL